MSVCRLFLVYFHEFNKLFAVCLADWWALIREWNRTGDSMSSSSWTEQRSHLSSVWARCMIFLTIFSRSVCSSNRSLTTSKSAWTPAGEKVTAADWEIQKLSAHASPNNHVCDYYWSGSWGWCDGIVWSNPAICWTSLTRLLSYSFLEAAKSWALEMAIPQKGRYICSTCGHTKLVETILSPAIFKSGPVTDVTSRLHPASIYEVHTHTHSSTLVRATSQRWCRRNLLVNKRISK